MLYPAGPLGRLLIHAVPKRPQTDSIQEKAKWNLRSVARLALREVSSGLHRPPSTAAEGDVVG